MKKLFKEFETAVKTYLPGTVSVSIEEDGEFIKVRVTGLPSDDLPAAHDQMAGLVYGDGEFLVLGDRMFQQDEVDGHPYFALKVEKGEAKTRYREYFTPEKAVPPSDTSEMISLAPATVH